ncbi:ATP-dependent metallopeptidase FtsH/Yme1/Tma family protein [Streptosporangium sp. NPDC023963]|uniref:ATP-dependent metallopeptidase FtsH/Yme1/Tma family protein n=1 Tax=Streptosporangium sp. NPDC023963 TaxID=3155608 RepID=UPI00342C96DE
MIEKQSAPPHQYQKKASRFKTFIVCSITASLVLTGGLFLLNRDDSQRTDMSTVLNQLRSGKVSTAKLIEAERRIEITTMDKKHFHSYWSEVGDQGSELADELQKAELPDGYTVEVPKR